MKTILILHENEPAGKTHFNMNDFPQRLLFKQRLKATRKWCIQVKVASFERNCREVSVGRKPR